MRSVDNLESRMAPSKLLNETFRVYRLGSATSNSEISLVISVNRDGLLSKEENWFSSNYNSATKILSFFAIMLIVVPN